MDRRGRERELASALLPALTASGALPPDQAALGFTRLLAAADDLALDHPDAGHQLTLFLGRAVVDEVLPPRFLAGVVPSLPGGGLGVGVVRGAGSLLSARHAAERFATCWAGGGGRGAAALAAATEG
jgi:programmed cell death protein 4